LTKCSVAYSLKRSSNFKETLQRASDKDARKTMPANPNITEDHSVIQGPPPSLKGTEMELLNTLVRSEPRQVKSDADKKIKSIVLCFTILQKVRCDPMEFLEGMKGVTQVVRLGFKEFQPTQILYLNLERLDKYVFPLFSMR